MKLNIFLICLLMAENVVSATAPMDKYLGQAMVEKAKALVEQEGGTKCKLFNGLQSGPSNVFHFEYICGEANVGGLLLKKKDKGWVLQSFSIESLRYKFNVTQPTRSKWLKSMLEEFNKEFSVSCKDSVEGTRQFYKCRSAKDPNTEWELILDDQTEKRKDTKLYIHLSLG